MGRKRIHPKKKPKKKWYQKEDDWGNFVFDWSLGLSDDTRRAIFSIIIIILAVIVLLGFFSSAGAFGDFLAKSIRFLFGHFNAYIFNFVLFYFGYILISPGRKDYRIAEFLGLVLLIFAFPAFLHLFVPEEAAKDAAMLGRNGGYFGYLLSIPLRNSIGLFPTFLLTIAAILISIIMIFDVPLFSYFSKNCGKLGEDGDLDGDYDPDSNQNQTRVSVFESLQKKFGSKKVDNQEALAVRMAKEQIDTKTGTVPVVRKDITWKYPSLNLLKEIDETPKPGDIRQNADMIQSTLSNFNIEVKTNGVKVGPTVTQYRIKPKTGVKLNQIVARQNDLALALSAKSIRIEAPIPGVDAVGIEIPNKVPAKVTLKELILSDQFKAIKSKLALALGRGVAGDSVAIDLEKMPHLLIAGSTGSGKSVCINSIITTFLFSNSPNDLKLLLVDPKRVELTCYNDIPHLLTPVVIDVDKTVSALKWTVWEMERRYKLFSDTQKRNISAYNEAMPKQDRLPYIVVIIDELADLMATSAKEVEASIVRLAQMARATGIHLIIATQRPSVDVLTGLIKANISARIAFATASQVDSRTILDMSGAEKLLGFGDMLFISPGNKPKRVQGCFVSDSEIETLVSFLKENGQPQYDEAILQFGASRGGVHGDGAGSAEDDLYDEAVETVVISGKASATLLQRRLKVGYARAARLLDILEENGVVGPADGAKPRDVLISSLDQISTPVIDSDKYVSTFRGNGDFEDSNNDINYD